MGVLKLFSRPTKPVDESQIERVWHVGAQLVTNEWVTLTFEATDQRIENTGTLTAFLLYHGIHPNFVKDVNGMQINFNKVVKLDIDNACRAEESAAA